ncbi:RPGR regulator, partial [Polypterus senegalus]|nr:RPGR regulator [Polypterus senegalus]
ESGAIFTFGKSKFADNVPSKFWLKNDKAVYISCGDEHTALITNGKLYVFGSNNWGQLGLGTKDTVYKPTCVKELKSERVKLVACGRNHTIVCTEQCKMYACGGNNEGQLGLDDAQERDTFHQIKFFTGKFKIKQLAAGSNISAALTADGKLYTFGESDNGKLGLLPEQLNNTRVPQVVNGVSDRVKQVACGGGHTVALSDDDVYTFGFGQYGQLGHGTFTFESSLPKTVSHFQKKKVKRVACGENHTAVITDDDVYTFGFGQYGQLGHGTFTFESSLPKTVSHFQKKKVKRVACGENHTAVITENGLLYTFGDGRHGKLGLGDENFTNQFKPTLCSRFMKYSVLLVACGGCHMLVHVVPRPKDAEPVIIQQDEINDNYLEKSYIEFKGDTASPGTLRRTLSARDRRRERVCICNFKKKKINNIYIKRK